jgi:hypothetical protein
MRLICPHCQQSVTVPDTTAGQPTPCPNCKQTLTPPALTGAAIDSAPEPVVAPRPAPAPPPIRAGSVSDGKPEPSLTLPARTISPGEPWLRLTLRRHIAHWLAPVGLVVALVLSFFTWVAVAPNGNRIYTQNAWQAAGGGFSTDLAGEAVMDAEKDLKPHTHWNPWLMFFLILIIPTAALAIADRVLTRQGVMIPDLFLHVWPHRQIVVAGLCVALLLLLVAPIFFGFGLERAVAAKAEEMYPSSQPAGAKEPTTKEKLEQDVKRDLTIARFGLHRTGWLCLAVTAQVVALFGAGLARWLDKHPNLPDPRVEVYC